MKHLAASSIRFGIGGAVGMNSALAHPPLRVFIAVVYKSSFAYVKRSKGN